MANRFWEEAFYLETGTRASLGKKNPKVETPADYVPPVPVKESFHYYPQLLVAVDRAEAMMWLMRPDYGVQEKKDGERVMVKVRKGVLTAGNKKGLVRQLPLNVRDALLAIKRNFVIDGELVGTQYFPFDLISVNDEDVCDLTYTNRYGLLSELLWDVDADSVEVVTLATTIESKLAMVKSLELNGKEGFVLKKLTAPYRVGETHGTQWKHQFRSVVSCIVGARNADKNSVEVFVKRSDGSLRSMGFVTVPGTYSFPKLGEIAEIENLYVHPGKDGKFAQAVFKGVRADADENDCREDKLRVKSI
jgi:bifunctional non-homologous end joining protein LigD